MASLTAVAANPTSVSSGGQSTITATIDNPDRTATVTVALDGQTGTASIDLHEAIVFSVDPADEGKPGHVVGKVDQGGTLAVGQDGQSFVFTAS